MIAVGGVGGLPSGNHVRRRGPKWFVGSLVVGLACVHGSALAQSSKPTIPQLVSAINMGYDRALVPEMLAQGIDINETDGFGQTPLIYLIDNDATSDGVQYAIDLGADVNHVTDAGWTPLVYAIRARDVYVVRVLIRAGANLHVAAPDGGDLIAETLAKYPDDRVERAIAVATKGEEEVLREEAERGSSVSSFAVDAPFEQWSSETAHASQLCHDQARSLAWSFGRASVIAALEYDPAVTYQLALDTLAKQFEARGYTPIAYVDKWFFLPGHSRFLRSPKTKRLGDTFTFLPTRALVVLTIANRSPIACLIRLPMSSKFEQP